VSCVSASHSVWLVVCVLQLDRLHGKQLADLIIEGFQIYQTNSEIESFRYSFLFKLVLSRRSE